MSILTKRRGVLLTGAAIGLLAPILVRLGNPGNMGFCVACFSRDAAGALGLHRAAAVQYLRPEIPGLVRAALIAALVFREFRPRAGGSPFARFLFGALAGIGALVFLGCPWRALLRLGGGDLNAITGLVGLAAGILLGVVFLRRGFSLGRSRPAPRALGWLWGAALAGLLLLLWIAPQFGRNPEGQPAGPIFFSAQGPGSLRAPILISLAAGLLIGFLGQRSRFCTVGGIRDLLIARSSHLFVGLAALVVVAAVTNLALGQFRLGFSGQPIAHAQHVWNFLGLALVGIACTLGGGCPGRQLMLSGEGDGDAAGFALGMFAGGAFAHNFNLASGPAGVSPYGPAAVLLGLATCVLLGLTVREAPASAASGSGSGGPAGSAAETGAAALAGAAGETRR